MDFDIRNIAQTKVQFAQLIREWNSKGWSVATSTNYSFRHPENKQIAIISKSGKDKQYFTDDDFMEVDENGHAVAGYAGIRPSAETLLHTTLYAADAAINVIVHSHSLYSTLLSRKTRKNVKKKLHITSYELIKAVDGFNTHLASLDIPVFDNSQDMEALSQEIIAEYRKAHFSAYLLGSHGLYTWGCTLQEAKRHLEAIEFLLECEYKFDILNK